MIWLKCKILVIFLVVFVREITAKLKIFSKTNQALEIQTDGLGCDVFVPNLFREPIPNTDLTTGTFYSVRMRSIKATSTKSIGFITWSWQKNPAKHKYIYADWHNELADYTVGARWYEDSHWAFLKSRHAGWYHLINCGFPSYYATWSNLEMENDGSGEYPFIISRYYPGNHSKDDFLFKPVKIENTLESRVFHLMTKAFGEGIVSVSDTTYSENSTYLQVESKQKWDERVREKGKEVQEKAMFLFEDIRDKYNYHGGHNDKCSCGNIVLYAVIVTLWTCIVVSVCLFKREIIIKHVQR